MTLFDRYVAIDWSAASRPVQGSDSVWIADRGKATSAALSNPATRRSAELATQQLIRSALADGQRMIIGVDATLGFPRGTARLLGIRGMPWRGMWDEVGSLVVDDDRNRNNRFDVAVLLNRRIQHRLSGRPSIGGGPFWGAPNGDGEPYLLRTKPAVDDLPEFRVTERQFRAVGLYPKSVWQLYGVGSVGSQTLTLIPVLRRLLDTFGAQLGVWPFQTGLRPRTLPPIVVAEVWPSQISRRRTTNSEVRDAVQVTEVVDAMAAADTANSLRSWFSPNVALDDRDDVEREEGWIAGPAIL